MNYKEKIIGIVIAFKEFVIGGPTKHPRDMSRLLLMDGLALYLRHGIQMQNQLILFDKKIKKHLTLSYRYVSLR